MKHIKFKPLFYFMLAIVVVSSLNQAQIANASKGSSLPKGHDFTKIPPGAHYKEGEVLVRFAPEGQRGEIIGKWSLAEKNQILSSLGAGHVIYEYKLVPGLNVVKLPPGKRVKGVLETLNWADRVLYAEPIYEARIASTFPNDTYFYVLWGMHNTGQEGGTVDADIDAPEAWDIHTDASNIVVAVIDSGVDYEHEDLSGNMWVNIDEFNGDPNVDDDNNGYVDDIYGYDFRNNDGDPMDDYDPVYHGTHCAGTIGAVGNNDKGVVGVCWQVKIMALKFMDSSGSGWVDDAIKCIEYSIDMVANLSNNSWSSSSYSQALKDVIDEAGEAGMLFVASAGQDYQDIDVPANRVYPACYDSESIITVLATDRDDEKRDSSNWGLTSVDLGAPGEDIGSCKPVDWYQYLSGTSMATSHVSGAAALLWSKEPELSHLDVKYNLLNTVDKIGALDGLCVSDGRLNVYKALLGAGTQFIIKDDLDNHIARFNSFGDLILKGTLEESSSHTATSVDEFRIQNPNGTDVAIIDATDGNMYIDGTLSENQSTLTPSISESNFVIKDCNDDVISYIDESGDMFLKGKLYEESNP